MSEQGSSPRVLDHMDHDSARQALLDVRHEVAKAVVGQDTTVTGLLIA
ncbi:MAG: AAA family ATPase, partial [Arthrobacter sp.]|nr:AAA family ATPase [Arthrobacter sp.]